MTRRFPFTIHFVVEGVLLVLALGVLFSIYQDGIILVPADPSFASVWRFLGDLTPILILVVALALSIRIGAVNLAVGFTALAAYMMASNAEVVLALLLSLVGGLILAAVLVFTRIPAWLAGLSLGMVAIGLSWSWWPTEAADFGLALGIDPDLFGVLFLLVSAMSIAVGVIGSRGRIRARIDQTVSLLSGQGKGSGGSVLMVFITVPVSSLLAGLAGILLAEPRFSIGLFTGGLNFSFLTTLIGLMMILAVVLLGGTGIRGGRGGFAGSVLATIVVFGGWNVWKELVAQPDSSLGMWGRSWYPIAVLGAGLLVNWLIETFGRTREVASQSG